MIGSNLVKALVKKGHEVFVVDNLWRGKLDYLQNNKGQSVINLDTHFLKADLTIPGVCDKLVMEVDMVIHLADIVAGDSEPGPAPSLFQQPKPAVAARRNSMASTAAESDQAMIFQNELKNTETRLAAAIVVRGRGCRWDPLRAAMEISLIMLLKILPPRRLWLLFCPLSWKLRDRLHH